MRGLLLALLIACGDKSTTGPAPIRNTATSGPTDALPADDAMGELALVPVANRDTETWLPVGLGPVLVEGVLREGKGPPPSWLGRAATRLARAPDRSPAPDSRSFRPTRTASG